MERTCSVILVFVIQADMQNKFDKLIESVLPYLECCYKYSVNVVSRRAAWGKSNVQAGPAR